MERKGNIPNYQEIVNEKLDRLEEVDIKGLAKIIEKTAEEMGINCTPMVETWLRKNNRNIYLVANIPDQFTLYQHEVRLFEGDTGDYPYYINFLPGDVKSRDTFLRQLGVDENENLDNLSQAGILKPKEGSVIARGLNALSN